MNTKIKFNSKSVPSDLYYIVSKLKEIREKMYTIEKMSELTGFPSSMIQKIELCDGVPQISSLIKYAEALGINIILSLEPNNLILEKTL